MNDDISVITEEDRKKFEEMSKDATPFFIGHHINDRNNRQKDSKPDEEKK